MRACVRSFNSRTREGCDTLADQGKVRMVMFQFTHPRGVRRANTSISALQDAFQFTHPRGVRLCRWLMSLGVWRVSIHAPARGATSVFWARADLEMFQFTHPRGVRPISYWYLSNILGFQFTHPRGVRRSFPSSTASPLMFQFTHPRGVRLLCSRTTGAETAVSIHAPARGATGQLDSFCPANVVSIHAPARGATRPRSMAVLMPSSFNSRTREGCDWGITPEWLLPVWFQFTHPRGVRP